MEKSIFSMAVFHNYVSHYQRVLGVIFGSKDCFFGGIESRMREAYQPTNKLSIS